MTGRPGLSPGDKKILQKVVTKPNHDPLALAIAAPQIRVREEVAPEASTRGADQVLESYGAQPTEGHVSITAVICDDHPAFAQGVAGLLEHEPDISVIGVATSGKEAIGMVRDLLPDIVLMDVVMPGIDGIETTRRVRAASPTTKVVVLTVKDEERDLFLALRAGAMGYITKDKEMEQIADAVRSVHRGHLVIPMDLTRRFIDDLEDADSEMSLSDEEREILAGIAQGEGNKEIAARLHLGERTLKRRVEDIYSKLQLADRLQTAIYAVQRGLNNSLGPRGHSCGPTGSRNWPPRPLVRSSC